MAYRATIRPFLATLSELFPCTRPRSSAFEMETDGSPRFNRVRAKGHEGLWIGKSIVTGRKWPASETSTNVDLRAGKIMHNTFLKRRASVGVGGTGMVYGVVINLQ